MNVKRYFTPVSTLIVGVILGVVVYPRVKGMVSK